MDTVIVTGGAGFIGSNFVRLLHGRPGPTVVVLDRLTYAGHRESLRDLAGSPRFSFAEGDIGDRALLADLFRRHQPGWVVNFAAETHVDRSIDEPAVFLRTNVMGVYELLEASRRHWDGLEASARERFRFLQVSTDEVYGSAAPGSAFSETTAYAPNSPYAATKAAADHLVRAWHATYALPALVTNCSNNYGPYQHPEKLVPLTLLNALEGRALPVYGDGTNVRDWVYVEDHCEGVLRALERGRPGERYLLGGGNERTTLQIVDAVCAALEERRPARDNPAMKAAGVGSYAALKTFVSDRPGHDRRYAIDAAKARAELGWSAAHSFEAGIARTVDWYLDHSDWREAVRAAGETRERRGLQRRSP